MLLEDLVAGVAVVAGAVADGPQGALSEGVGFEDVARVAVRVFEGFGSRGGGVSWMKRG